MTLSLIGLSGSLRRRSYSTAVLLTLRDVLPDDVRLDVRSLEDIPLFNDDLDGEDAPVSVVALRRAVAAADGLVVISPEYNHGMSGVMKNALDWLSRPGMNSCLRDKPALTMTASPSALGGVRAQQQLNETFIATCSRLVIRRQIVIGMVAEKVMDGRLVHPPTLDFVLEGFRDLRDVCG
ncbi:chromate reductase [Brevundimonas bullata]|uniref:Chromate reductase n=1 Tax=Brevundimonas bullata TaxID=13160 RepID=A0A7W7IRM0_9CAUL|nr:NADPH-dependent FMN reductase [Brevundimonas bullata]MBB4799269.1 chromate reductase [Brevundimonas bullata]MBB6384037.1 chromate reductase [Brevundimonas bullata]